MNKILLMFILISNVVMSQRDKFIRSSFWTETIISGTIKNKFKWQFDYQYRRQSDASDEGGSNNIFSNNFQHVYRPWIHYQLNENVRMSLSPIGFWETYSPIQTEFRICPQLTLTNKINRIQVDQRYRYEFRFIGPSEKGRIRYSLKLTIPITRKTMLPKTIYLTTWNEFFISVGNNIYNDKIFDQNRTFCLVGYKLNEFVRFEAGYGQQIANRFVSTIKDGILIETVHRLEKNNILQIYCIVNIK